MLRASIKQTCRKKCFMNFENFFFHAKTFKVISSEDTQRKVVRWFDLTVAMPRDIIFREFQQNLVTTTENS